MSAYRCSCAQREQAMRLLRDIEMDERVVTLMTMRRFELAGLPPPFEGSPLDDALRELSPQMCSDLITSLRDEIGEDESDEEEFT